MNVQLDRARGVSLRRLFPDAQFYGDSDFVVTSCTSDSRRLQPGELFVALVGCETDGHEFAFSAVQAGASAVLAERLLPVRGAPVCVVEDTRIAYARLCQALAGNPSEQIKVIGVTGTNGKTTTTCLIASILQAAGYQPGVMGTLGYCDSREISAAELTTPGAEVLAPWLARMAAEGCTHAVMEVSSHALSQSRVAGIAFDSVCFTNIRRDHLDYHTTLQNYRAAKARLLDHLAPHGFAVINSDDPGSAEILKLVTGPALSVGIDQPAEITATIVERFASEQTFLLSAGNETAVVRTRMIGDHNVENCLVATAIGLGYGISLATIVRGLEAAGQVPGRLERIECGQDFGVFVDYAHTPDALAVSLQALRQVYAGRLICVFGAGGNRDRKKRPLMAAAVERAADMAIVTTDNPRREDPSDICDQIVSGFSGSADMRVILDRGEAIAWALAEARPGDVVLIAGKGHETHQVFGKRKVPLDDREVARGWLYDRPTAPRVFAYAG